MVEVAIRSSDGEELVAPVLAAECPSCGGTVRFSGGQQLAHTHVLPEAEALADAMETARQHPGRPVTVNPQ